MGAVSRSVADDELKRVKYRQKSSTPGTSTGVPVAGRDGVSYSLALLARQNRLTWLHFLFSSRP